MIVVIVPPPAIPIANVKMTTTDAIARHTRIHDSRAARCYDFVQ